MVGDRLMSGWSGILLSSLGRDWRRRGLVEILQSFVRW